MGSNTKRNNALIGVGLLGVLATAFLLKKKDPPKKDPDASLFDPLIFIDPSGGGDQPIYDGSFDFLYDPAAESTGTGSIWLQPLNGSCLACSGNKK